MLINRQKGVFQKGGGLYIIRPLSHFLQETGNLHFYSGAKKTLSKRVYLQQNPSMLNLKCSINKFTRGILPL